MKRERKNIKSDSFLRYSQPQRYRDPDAVSFSYKQSITFIDNVIAKKELQRSIPFDLEGGGEIAITSASQRYIDRRGKNLYLTAPQIKLVTALTGYVNSLLKGNEGYIKKLPFRIEDRANGEHVNGFSTPIQCQIDMPELAKRYYGKTRVGGKQVDDVRSLLLSLADVWQEIIYKNDQGDTFKTICRLIYVKIGEYKDKDGKVIFNKANVAFEDVFVYEINDKYSLSPQTELRLWNEAGVNTDLFAILYYVLKRVWGNHVKHSERIVKAKRKDLQKEKTDPSKIEKELAKLKEQTLTYRESISSLLERIGSRKYLDKGKYLRKDKIEKDLDQAVAALKHIGIIKRYYPTTGAGGDIVCNFVINDKWLIDEAEKMRRSLPPSEAPEKDQK